MIRTTCPHCERKIKVNPELAGRTVLCPKCRGQFQIPVETVEAVAVDVPAAPPVQPTGLPIIQTANRVTQPARPSIKPVTIVALGIVAVLVGLPCLCAGLVVIGGGGKVQQDGGGGFQFGGSSEVPLTERLLEPMTDEGSYAEGWNELLSVAQQHVAKMENQEPGSPVWHALIDAHHEIIRVTTLRYATGIDTDMDRHQGRMDVLMNSLANGQMQHFRGERLRAGLTSLKRHGELEEWLALNPGYADMAREWGLIK